jgi:phosphoribosyl-ATP pyrophosphohydrolase
MNDDVLKLLEKTIRARKAASGDVSYTRKLLDGGPEKCAKKLGEEAVETVIAGVSQDNAALTGEAADLLYHLLVLLEVRDVPLDDVLTELESRMGQSGLEEKASRGKDG